MLLSKEDIYQKVAAGQITVKEAAEYLKALEVNKVSIDKEVSENGNVSSFELSEGQKGLWINYQYSPDSYTYNIPIAFSIKSKININALKRTFQIIYNNHPSLRISFHNSDEEVIQKIGDKDEVDFNHVRISNLNHFEIQQKLKKEARKPYNLQKGGLFRVTLFSNSDIDHILIICFHHIMFDGISLAIFMRDLEQCYQAEIAGKTYTFPKQRASYADFVNWQKEMLKSGEWEKHRKYWTNQLGGDVPVLELPIDKPRPVTATYKGAAYNVNIGSNLTENIEQLAEANNTTVFTVLLAAFNVLLHRYTSQEEILVGTPVSGRPETKFEEAIGYFVNMLVIKSNMKGNPAFKVFLQQLHETLLDGFEHSDYPYYSVVREIKNEKGKNTSNSLFRVSFSFQNWAKDVGSIEAEFGKNPLFKDPIKDIYQEVEYDIALEIYRVDDGYSVLLKYNQELFEEDTISRMACHYINILDDVCVNSEKPVSKLKLLTEQEEHKILVEWNDNDAEYPDKCIHELFEEQAKRTPNAIAVVCENQKMTYGELDQKSSQLAYYLNVNGVEAGTFVGIFMERSIEVLVCLLGVLKAGGAYVPLDPIYPTDRLSYMIEDTKAPVLLTQSSLLHKLPEYCGKIVEVDKEWDTITENFSLKLEGKDGGKHFKKASPDNVVYILYTSGSTGKPKGVQVVHRGLVITLTYMSKQPGFTSKDWMLAIATICFDMSVVEMFLPIINGGIVEILPESYIRDGQKLKDKIENCKATVIQATPATWQMLVSAGWSKKVHAKLLTGGDTLTKELAEKLFKLVDEVWNGWGPTETSIYNSNILVKPGEKITIGRPYDNNKFYILDKYLNIVPIGVIGEAYLGGEQLALGYLNRPELNEKSFIPNPFSKEKGSRIYKTGDLVRYLPDGKIDIIGRADRMVKFRGFRIELEEIESALLKGEDVKEAVALVREDNAGNKQLYAFIKRKDDAVIISKEQRKEELRKWLPYYMIPTMYIQLETFPLTLNFKVDKKVLLNSKISEIIEKYGEKEKTVLKEVSKNPEPVVLKENLSPEVKKETIDKALSSTVKKKEIRKEKKSMNMKETNNILLKFIQSDILEMASAAVNLKVDEIDLNTNIEEYGLDSISVTTLLVKLRQKFQMNISPALFFEYTTLGKFSSFLLNNYYDTIRNVYEDKLKEFVDKDCVEEKIEEDIVEDTFEEASTVIVDEQDTACNESKQNLKLDKETEPIAIIGISAILPQSSSLDEFWNKLEAGMNFVTEVPIERWNAEEYYGDPLKDENKSNSKWGGFIKDVDKFDAAFFNISKRDAELMDPQQRIFLETAWMAIENSGHRPAEFSGTKTGVFVGVSGTEYADVLRDNGYNTEAYYQNATGQNIVANRVSYTLNLQGPSISIDTGASSSLYAIHHAVNALRIGECDIAIAGGVNLLLSPRPYIAMSKLGLLSSDSKCKVFDKSADGYVRGEGVGALLLKPLGQAIKDNDDIYAVIKGTAANHGGFTNSISSPNASAQTGLLVDLYKKSQVEPETLEYIEVSGSSTILGDLSEVNGLKAAFEELLAESNSDLPKESFCGIGTVKSNIGNLEAASGIASVIKIILSMKNKKIPASINVNEDNPYMELDDSPFYIVRETSTWNKKEASLPRRAGVSSIGLGGVNVHVVLEEYEESASSRNKLASGEYVIVLSAKDRSKLVEYAGSMVNFLEEHMDEHTFGIADLAYTLQLGREGQKVRVAVIASSLRDLKDKLASFCQNKKNIQKVYFSTENKNSGNIVHLIDGDEGEAFVKKLAEEKKMEKLAQLWVDGGKIKWELLYSSYTPKRVHLPSCSFDKERYWVQDKNDGIVSTESKITVLGFDEPQADENFIYRWSTLHKIAKQTFSEHIDTTKEYLKYKSKVDNKICHLLVKTSSSKKMEAVVSGMGNKKTILLISGFGLTAASFYYQFREWSSEYQVINIHIPAIGMSEPSNDVSLQGIARGFMDVLVELGVKFPIHVVAICWGSMIGQAFAEQYQDQVASLTLCSAFTKWKVFDMEKLEGKIKKDFYDLNFHDYYDKFVASHSLNPKAAEYLIEVFTSEGYSTDGIVQNIKLPTFCISGTHDIVIDQNEPKLINSIIPNSEYHEIEGAGHGIFMTHNREFNDKVMKFIKKHDNQKESNVSKLLGKLGFGK